MFALAASTSWLIVGGWLVASVVVGVLVGRAIDLGDRPYPGEEEHEGEDAGTEYPRVRIVRNKTQGGSAA